MASLGAQLLMNILKNRTLWSNFSDFILKTRTYTSRHQNKVFIGEVYEKRISGNCKLKWRFR